MWIEVTQLLYEKLQNDILCQVVIFLSLVTANMLKLLLKRLHPPFTTCQYESLRHNWSVVILIVIAFRIG